MTHSLRVLFFAALLLQFTNSNAIACADSTTVPITIRSGIAGQATRIDVADATGGVVQRWMDDDGLLSLLVIHQTAKHGGGRDLKLYRSVFVDSLERFKKESATMAEDGGLPIDQREWSRLFVGKAASLLNELGAKNPLNMTHVETFEKEFGPTLVKAIEQNGFVYEFKDILGDEELILRKLRIAEFGPSQNFVSDVKGATANEVLCTSYVLKGPAFRQPASALFN